MVGVEKREKGGREGGIGTGGVEAEFSRVMRILLPGFRLVFLTLRCPSEHRSNRPDLAESGFK